MYSLDNVVATAAFLHHSASHVGVAGTIQFQMFLFASTVLRDQLLSLPHHPLQLPCHHLSGTAHLRLDFVTGTTQKRMTLTGIDSLVAPHRLGLVPLQITRQEVRKVRIKLRSLVTLYLIKNNIC